ncbi:hypothetical protein I7X12_12375 [Halosimplex litoreum]|uniref:Uncharacterized protein n=1 Tax=Halosimplex litoreum TaxID=1198301 RepID=A0A7T3KU37_9EURY|nr:hypothetical protein [Halosimplex litoreum]QPV61558.1 hypothetical protein I7X12_12375 [Halosimplex litoreum]
MEDEEIELAIKMVEYLVKNKVTGNHKKQVDTVINKSGLPVHAKGDARDVLEEIATSPPPIEMYGGGHRQNVRLTSIQDGVEFIEENGGDPPWGF